jgi:hypothetical protein
VVLEHLVFGDAEAAGGFLGFGAAALRELSTSHFAVAGVAVRDGDELDEVALGGEFGCDPARAYIGVIRVGSERDHADIPILALSNGTAGGECEHRSSKQ